ncbi:short chain dehydrogenase, partial [Klebsiella pneumoniae]
MRDSYRGYVTPPKGSPDKARRTTIREARLPTFDTIL